LGNISRVTGLSLITVHSLARVVFGFSLLLFCYLFLSLFIEDEFKRSLAFILISISGGFGWLRLFSAVDVISESWFLTGWVEGNTFLSVYSLPLFSASFLMLLAVFYLMIRSFETEKLVYSFWAGVVCFLLISTHFYDALIVYPVIILYVAAKYFISKDKRELLKSTSSFFVMFLISLLSPLYNFWVSVTNPVFREWAWKSAITLSPGFLWYLGLFGLLSILSAIGIVYVLFDFKSPLFYRRFFLAVWALSVPFLIYAPIAFQRRLIEGVHVPMAILASIGIVFLIQKFKWNKKLAAAIFIVLLIPGNLTLLSRDMNYLRENASRESVAGFLDRDIYEAIEWLKSNTKRENVVLADYEIGNYVPAISGNTVFVGHSPETIDFWGKWALVKRFFNEDASDEFRKEFLRTSEVRYIIYSWKEKKIGLFDPNVASYLARVYSNQTTSIFKVEL